MRILLIKPKHIGDSLILTPTIRAIKLAYPEAEISVIVRRGCEGILEGCPDIARIFTLPEVERKDRKRGDLWHQAKTLFRLWSAKFDYVFELGDGHRARFFSMLVRTKWRYSVKTAAPLKGLARRRFTAVSSFDWGKSHRVEKDFYSVSEFLPLALPIPPLIFEKDAAKVWEPARSLNDFCVMQVGSRQGFNRWHREGWKEVGRALLERFSQVVVSCGPVANERQEADWLQQELGSRVISTQGQTQWPEMAWLLGQARLYVGLDTAAMHLAAACGCPVVALLGPTNEEHWHPWRARYRIVTSPGSVPLADPVQNQAPVKKRAMNEIKAEDVIAACDELLRRTNFTK